MGVLWYETVQINSADSVSNSEMAKQMSESDDKADAASQTAKSNRNNTSLTKRVLRTSIYNMVRNTWRTIRLCYESSAHQPSFRFGASVIPIFNRHVAMREQYEAISKIAPRSNGPVPLERLLIFGGINLDDFEENATG